MLVVVFQRERGLVMLIVVQPYACSNPTHSNDLDGKRLHTSSRELDRTYVLYIARFCRITIHCLAFSNFFFKETELSVTFQYNAYRRLSVFSENRSLGNSVCCGPAVWQHASVTTVVLDCWTHKQVIHLWSNNSISKVQIL